jgi:transposase
MCSNAAQGCDYAESYETKGASQDDRKEKRAHQDGKLLRDCHTIVRRGALSPHEPAPIETLDSRHSRKRQARQRRGNKQRPERYVECPRFRGHLSAWSALSDRAGGMRHHAKGIEPSEAVSAEFRREAVALYRRSGRPLREIAHDLGVSSESLRLWAKQSAVDAGEQPGLTSEEREELRRLRRAVRTLREEREILKKAAAFFAKEARAGERLSVHRQEEGRALREDALPCARCQPLRLPRLGASGALGA